MIHPTDESAPPKPGDVVLVQAYKSDNKPYRWWKAVVESADAEHIATISMVGDVVKGTERGWTHRHHTRNIYWFGRPYNLAEVYEPDGSLKQLYVHIASFPALRDRQIRYVDLELDAIKRTGQPIRIADADEFAGAATRFGYAPDFQEACWRAVDEARNLLLQWKPGGPPLKPARGRAKNMPSSRRSSQGGSRSGRRRRRSHR